MLHEVETHRGVLKIYSNMMQATGADRYKIGLLFSNYMTRLKNDDFDINELMVGLEQDEELKWLIEFHKIHKGE